METFKYTDAPFTAAELFTKLGLHPQYADFAGKGLAVNGQAVETMDTPLTLTPGTGSVQVSAPTLDVLNLPCEYVGEQAQAATTEQPANDGANVSHDVHPVQIGGVTVTEPITHEHVLASQGIVTVTNDDGSVSQYSKADAQEKMNQLEQFKAKLG